MKYEVCNRQYISIVKNPAEFVKLIMTGTWWLFTRYANTYTSRCPFLQIVASFPKLCLVFLELFTFYVKTFCWLSFLLFSVEVYKTIFFRIIERTLHNPIDERWWMTDKISDRNTKKPSFHTLLNLLCERNLAVTCENVVARWRMMTP